MPHLALAMTINWILHLERVRASRRAPQAYLAIVDSRGASTSLTRSCWICSARSGPAWVGASVPDDLLRHLSSGTPYRGRTLIVHSCAVGGFWLVDIRQLTSADTLSPREAEIARRFSKGASSKEIARTLGISPNTARHHLREVYRKLEVSDKAELAEKLSTSTEFDVELDDAPMLVDIAGARTPTG